MKRSPFYLFLSLMLICVTAHAAPLGRAAADFDNTYPQRGETAWGRFAADAIQSAAHSDIALINAGALKAGVLRAGEISSSQVNALLSFPGDEIVTISISGAQLHAALERAVQAYPTGSTAFLHGAGFTATFNTQAPTNERLTMLRINGREVQNDDSIRAAMPSGLAQGGAGYFTIWNGDKAVKSKATVSQAIASLVKSSGAVSPDDVVRLLPQ